MRECYDMSFFCKRTALVKLVCYVLSHTVLQWISVRWLQIHLVRWGSTVVEQAVGRMIPDSDYLYNILSQMGVM